MHELASTATGEFTQPRNSFLLGLCTSEVSQYSITFHIWTEVKVVFVPALLQEVVAHVDLFGPEEALVKVLGVVRGHGDHAL